jgi:hypothetical protein
MMHEDTLYRVWMAGLIGGPRQRKRQGKTGPGGKPAGPALPCPVLPCPAGPAVRAGPGLAALPGPASPAPGSPARGLPGPAWPWRAHELCRTASADAVASTESSGQLSRLRWQDLADARLTYAPMCRQWASAMARPYAAHHRPYGPRTLSDCVCRCRRQCRIAPAILRRPSGQISTRPADHCAEEPVSRLRRRTGLPRRCRSPA